MDPTNALQTFHDRFQLSNIMSYISLVENFPRSFPQAGSCVILYVKGVGCSHYLHPLKIRGVFSLWRQGLHLNMNSTPSTLIAHTLEVSGLDNSHSSSRRHR